MISRPFSPLLVAVLLAFSSSAWSAGEDLKDINRLYQQGQTNQALDQVNAYLAGKPKDPQARFLKGVILTDQKKTEEAIKVFTSLTEEYPELPEPYNNLAVLYASLGQYERAKIALELAIRTHPSYATAHENLGDIYAQLASRAYDKALQLDASNATAQTKLSMIKDLFGNKTTARTAAKQSQAKAELAKQEIAKPDSSKATVATVTDDSTKSSSSKSAKATSNSGEKGEIISTLEAWAKAWSSKDVDEYLSFYAPTFELANGENRGDWAQTRKKRIEAPKTIEVHLSDFKVTANGANEATVVFKQNYRSNILKSSGSKTMHMIKSDGKWLIKAEKARG